MKFIFYCYGHENILGTHRTTLEFTKDPDVTKKGDCIIGVRADFDYIKLREFVKKNSGKMIRAEIIVEDLKDEFSFFLNSCFSDKNEIVIRKTGFNSERTLGIGADKAAMDINRALVEMMEDGNSKMEVVLKT